MRIFPLRQRRSTRTKIRRISFEGDDVVNRTVRREIEKMFDRFAVETADVNVKIIDRIRVRFDRRQIGWRRPGRLGRAGNRLLQSILKENRLENNRQEENENEEKKDGEEKLLTKNHRSRSIRHLVVESTSDFSPPLLHSLPRHARLATSSWPLIRSISTAVETSFSSLNSTQRAIEPRGDHVPTGEKFFHLFRSNRMGFDRAKQQVRFLFETSLARRLIVDALSLIHI